MHRGRCHRSAAPFYQSPHEEIKRVQSVSGGGGGGLHRVVCDAVEPGCEQQQPAGGAVRGTVVGQRRAAEGGEDPELAAAAAVRRPRGCVLRRGVEAAEGPAAEEQPPATR